MADDKEIKIDVTAEDKASAVITDAAKNAEAAIKKLTDEQKKLDAATKESFKNTKSSTEFFGTIANLAGGSELSSFASQMAGLTEKTAQFNEVAKAGGGAAIAMKVGLGAAAAAVGFQLGKALGDIVFETERWNRELERADKTAAKLESRRLSALSERASDFQSGLEFSEDPTAAIQERISQLGTEMSDLANVTIPATKKSLDELYDAGSLSSASVNLTNLVALIEDQSEYAKSFLNDNTRLTEEQEQQLANHEATLELYRQEKHELERLVGIEAERQKKRQERAEIESSSSAVERLQQEYNALQATLTGEDNYGKSLAGVVAADAEAAMELLQGIQDTKQAIADKQKAESDAIKKAAEEQRALEKERQELDRAKQQEDREAQRLADLKQSELDKLQEEILLMEQGAEAARAFRLEKQGLSKEDAAAIAAAESRLEASKAGPTTEKAGTNSLQAFESRLLTRGRSGGDVQDQIEKNTKEVANAAKEQRTILNETKAILKQIADKNTVSLEVVA